MDVLSGGGLGTPKPPWYMFLIRFKMTSYGKLPILLSASQEALLAIIILQTHVQGYKLYYKRCASERTRAITWGSCLDDRYLPTSL